MKSLIDIVPKKTIDQKAFTVKELIEAWGITDSTVYEKLRKRNDVEKVYKLVNGKLKPAYRLKKEKK